MIIRPDADAGQVVREPVRAIVKLLVGHMPITAGHRHPFGNGVGGMLEQVGDVQ